MKEYYSNLLSDKSWLIQEDSWSRHNHTARETHFTMGNGELGLRGILEEVPPESVPGTYVAGLYDSISAQETEMVNLPNPLSFKITVNGEKLGNGAMPLLQHKRTLDMKQGILTRRTVFQDSRKRKYDYQSLRFVSQDNDKLLGFQIRFTPLDKDAEITVRHDIDAGVSNRGVLTEGKKRHFQISHVSQSGEYDFLCVKTLEKGYFVAYASALQYQLGHKKVTTGLPAFKLKVPKNKTVVFTKLVALAHSRDPYSGYIERTTRDSLDKALRLGFDSVLQRHRTSFKALWNTADVAVKGHLSDQRAIRFNLYHLLIVGPRKPGTASVGAKTLSGEGYRGHVFWDADIFIVPFFIFNFPSIARNMLIYRYDRLSAARELAKKYRCKGAKFPWESADSGEECTPEWAKDFDGRIIKVRTGEQEHHIVADVAFTFYYYAMVTGDEDFLLRYGYELFFETARFWASRVTFNKKRKSYDIKRVIGPDEFHEGVNNNAFTNMMAQWNLHWAYRMYHKFKVEHKIYFSTLTNELQLKPSEVKNWAKIAKNIFIPIRKDYLIEQFEGYFKKKRVRIGTYNKHGLPDIPVGLDLSQISRTQFVKQADVVILLHLLSGRFSKNVKKKNFEFYLPRTLHKSSLSPSTHAAVGNEVGDPDHAYKLFQMALRVDLDDSRGGMVDGMHAASLGGVWQTIVNGFGGVRFVKDHLEVSPRIPKTWKRLSFQMMWRGHLILFNISRAKLDIYFKSKKKTNIPITVFGKLVALRPNKHFTSTIKS